MNHHFSSSKEGRLSHPSLSYRQCGDCYNGWLTLKDAKRQKRCSCNNGLRLTINDAPERLVLAVSGGRCEDH